MFISAKAIFNMNPFNRKLNRVRQRPRHLRDRSDDEVLEALHGGTSGIDVRGRSSTRRDTATTAEDSKVASLLNSETERLAMLVNLCNEFDDLVIHKQNILDGRVDAKVKLVSKGSVGLASGAAGIEGGDEGDEDGGIKSESLGAVFDILEAHDSLIEDVNNKFNEVNNKLDILIMSLNKSVQQQASEVAGTDSQDTAAAVSGGEGGSGEGGQRAVEDVQQQQQQQRQQEGVVVGGGAGQTDQEQLQQDGRQQQQQQRPVDGAGQVQQQQRRPWRNNYDNNDAILRRQREQRGPYMIVYNLPEEQGLRPHLQNNKDLNDVKYIVSYIEDEEDHDYVLKDHIVEVTRLGKHIEGKCRPVRVRFVGQLYRDAAVSLGYRIRYLHKDSHRNEVLGKAVLCKDLCREDREKAKEKYLLKKQQRMVVAADEPNITTEPRAGNQAPHPNFFPATDKELG